MTKRIIKFAYEKEIIKALNYTNKTDCDYTMGLDITVFPPVTEDLGFSERLNPTHKKYAINFYDSKYNNYLVTFQYSCSSKIDYFDILDIKKLP